MTDIAIQPIKPNFVKSMKDILSQDLPYRFEDILMRFENPTETEKVIIAYMMNLRQNPASTQHAYLNTVSNFFTFTGVSVSHVLPHHVDDWLFHYTQKGLLPSSINFKLSAIKAFFKYLHGIGFLRINPTATIRGRRDGGDFSHEKVLTKSEAQRILDCGKDTLSARNYLLITVMLRCGIRVSECVSLYWGDIWKDVQGRSFLKIVGKGGKVRNVYVPEELYNEFMLWRYAQLGVPSHVKNRQIDEIPIFTGRGQNVKPITTTMAYKIVRSFGKMLLGKEISPHWLRHTFATHSRLATATIEQIRDQLGYGSIQTTMKYEHSPHFMKPAGAVLEDCFKSDHKLAR